MALSVKLWRRLTLNIILAEKELKARPMLCDFSVSRSGLPYDSMVGFERST